MKLIVYSVILFINNAYAVFSKDDISVETKGRLFKGKQLQEEKTLSRTIVQEHDTVIVHLSFRGSRLTCLDRDIFHRQEMNKSFYEDYFLNQIAYLHSQKLTGKKQTIYTIGSTISSDSINPFAPDARLQFLTSLNSKTVLGKRAIIENYHLSYLIENIESLSKILCEKDLIIVSKYPSKRDFKVISDYEKILQNYPQVLERLVIVVPVFCSAAAPKAQEVLEVAVPLSYHHMPFVLKERTLGIFLRNGTDAWNAVGGLCAIMLQLFRGPAEENLNYLLTQSFLVYSEKTKEPITMANILAMIE